MFQPVNEGLIAVEPFTARLTAMGQVFQLFRPHQGGRLVKCDPPTSPGAVDACGSLSPNGKRLCVTLLNRSATEAQTIKLILLGTNEQTATARILSVVQLEPDAVMDERVERPTHHGANAFSFRLPAMGIARVEACPE